MNGEDKNQDMSGCIIRYLHGDIPENEQQALYLWLQESPENKESFFQMKSIYESTRRHKLMSAEEVEKSWRRLERKLSAGGEGKSGRPGRPFFLRLLGYAAVAVAAACIGFGAAMFARAPMPEVAAAFNEVCVPRGGKPSVIRLSDGTSVRLNTAGVLRYPSGFSGDRREVYLDGEAWFDVAHDEAKPFVVRIERQDVVVHGTRFNVEAYSEEAFSAVTLLEGSLSLDTSDDSGKRLSRVFLRPGQKASFDRATGCVSVEDTPEAGMSNAWMRGEFRFKDEPLGFIAGRLEKYYNVRITLEEELKGIRYTGAFSSAQSISQVLNIINHEKQFYFLHEEGNGIRIGKQESEPKR
jgi:ferric-dicitrate binding protein FerR (iron transport regulator)